MSAGSIRIAQFVFALVVLAILYISFTFSENEEQLSVQHATTTVSSLSGDSRTRKRLWGGDGHHEIKRKIAGSNAELVLKLVKSGQGSRGRQQYNVNGQHQVAVRFLSSTPCPYPRFQMRLIGNSLVRVDLTQDSMPEGSSRRSLKKVVNRDWHGTFSIPVVGQYTVDFRWYGCDLSEKDATSGSVFPTDPAEKKSIVIEAVDAEPLQSLSAVATDGLYNDAYWSPSQLFPGGSQWINGSLFASGDTANRSRSKFLWTNPGHFSSLSPDSKLNALHHVNNVLHVSKGQRVLLTDSIVQEPPSGFYQFEDLGNYELLCFVGSASMARIHEIFLELRPQLFPNQRPFKFHLYPITMFKRPGRSWSADTKTRIRKCKHVLVSIDEFASPGLSQLEYYHQVTAFLHQATNMINDTTFPVWIFSVNESPTHPTNCFVNTTAATVKDDQSPIFPRTTDHPCNDVLRYIFRQRQLLQKGSNIDKSETIPMDTSSETSLAFPSRVRFLDNTDLSAVMFHDEYVQTDATISSHLTLARDDVLANIALRVYVIVGKMVSYWRSIGQHGLIDGLHRNDTVEPNFELVPYQGWG
jgi:hypothetical protein